MTRKTYAAVAAYCFLIQAVGIGIFVAYGVVFNSLVEEFQWSRAVVSGASSTAFLLSGLCAILVGRLNDTYGPRTILSITACFFGAGLMLMSLVQQVWHLYLFFGVIFGVGLSAIDVIALTTTARWFTRSRGFMTGIVKVGTGAGQLVFPLLASLLIVHYGWRITFVILGGLGLTCLVLIARKLQRDPGVHTWRRETGADGGSESSGEAWRRSPGLSSSEAFRTVQLWLLFSITLLTVYCLLTILVHIVPHASDLGLPPTQAAGVLSTIGAVSMVGRFASGIAIDRFGCKSIAVACYLTLIASLAWLLSADNLWMLYTFGAIYGLAHGSFFTFISPIVVEIFGLASHGALFGIIVFAGTAGGSIGPLIAGQVFDLTNSYTIVFKILTVLSLMALGLVLTLKPIARSPLGSSSRAG